jgi:hypothetical protein
MTVRKALVQVGGFLAELSATDTLDAARLSGVASVDSVHAGPLAVSYAATVTLDVSVRDVFEIGTLTGDTTISFANSAAGYRGFIWVTQDATGGRRVGFVAPTGFTINELAADGTNAAQGALAITRYDYSIYLLGSASYIDIGRSVRTATESRVINGSFLVARSGDRVMAG